MRFTPPLEGATLSNQSLKLELVRLKAAGHVATIARGESCFSLFSSSLSTPSLVPFRRRASPPLVHARPSPVRNSEEMDRRCESTKTTGSTLLPPSAVVAGAAHSGLRGWRLSMEDEVVTELIGPQLGCFAVLDGHGGRFCSHWSADELPQRLRHMAYSEAVSEGDEAWQVAQRERRAPQQKQQRHRLLQ